MNSVIIAAGGESVCMGLATVISWTSHRTNVKGRAVLEYLKTLPIAISSIVMAIGIIWAWFQLGYGRGVS